MLSRKSQLPWCNLGRGFRIEVNDHLLIRIVVKNLLAVSIDSVKAGAVSPVASSDINTLQFHILKLYFTTTEYSLWH